MRRLHYLRDHNVPYDVLSNGIPKVVWSCLPSRLVTSDLHSHQNALRIRNSSWSFILMTDFRALQVLHEVNQNVPGLLNMFRRLKFGQARADLIRYALLETFGGVYLDITKCPIRPLSDIFTGLKSIALTFERNSTGGERDALGKCIHGEHLVANWMMGASPSCGFFERFLADIVDRATQYEGVTFKNPKHAILSLTGPIALTNFVASNHDFASFTRNFDFGEEAFPRVSGNAIPMTPRRHYAHYQNRKILKQGL